MMGCARFDDDSIKTRQDTSLQPVASPELSVIDSLMWQRPDSALAMLLPCFDTCRADVSRSVSTTHDRHYAHLLQAELLYKNDSAQTNRVELRQAVAYYDSLLQVADTRGVSLHRPVRRDASNASDADTQTIAFLDARAHYINGVGYYERDSIVEACREYLKALEIMEEHFGVKELVGEKARFMALTYTHLAGLFSDQYLHEQAIYFGKKALGYYQKYEATPWHMAWVLDEIGSHYEMMDRYDSANYYYHKSLSLLPDTNNLIYRDISTRLAFLSYKMNGVTQTSLNQLQILFGQSENKREALSRCAIIGEIYYHEGIYDSAWFHLKKVFQESQNIDSKKQAAEWLVDICKTKGWDSEIMEYAEFLVPFANLNENQSHLKSQITTLFQIYEQERQETLHQNKLKNALRKGGLVILGLVTAFFIGFTIYVVISKRRIIAERKTHQMQQAALSGRLKRSNSALKALKTAQEIGASKNLQQKEVFGKYEDEAICRHILSVCNDKRNSIKSTVPVSAYVNIALDDAQKAQLKQAATRHYGELFGKLKAQYPNLKEKDFFYCYLCLLGLDNTQIAVMLQRSSSTIWEREKHLQKIFDSHSKISVFLHEYMMD